jgi:mannopine transport system substrate-binding protein
MPSRRAVLAAPALVAASSIFGGARAQSDLESTVVIRTSGGAFETALKKNFFEPFTKASGVRVIPIAASDSEMQARMAAMSAAGRVEWDIVSPQYDELPNLARYLVDLADCGVLPAVAAEGVAGTCGRYGILYVIGAQVLAYNTTAFPQGKGPQSWGDFWDVQKFPGRRGLSNSGGPWATLVSALIADGVEPTKLFPLDLDRAFRKLDEIKPHIAVWWRTGDQSQQILRSGEVQMALMWSGRAFASKRQGVPLAWNYDKTFANFGAWAMLKDAPHPKAARAFLDFYMKNPEAHAAFSREMGYSTPSKAGQALLTADEKIDLVSSPQQLAGIIQMDPAWIEANRASGLERWNRWISR